MCYWYIVKYYVPVDDGWEEVLVRNVLHYVPISAITHLVYLLDTVEAVAKTKTGTHDKTLSSEPVTQNCIGQESNSGYLL